MKPTVTSCRLHPQTAWHSLKTAVGLTGGVGHRAVTLVDMPFKVLSDSINQGLATFLVTHRLPEISGLHFSHFACHYWGRSLLICLCKGCFYYILVISVTYVWVQEMLLDNLWTVKPVLFFSRTFITIGWWHCKCKYQRGESLLR